MRSSLFSRTICLSSLRSCKPNQPWLILRTVSRAHSTTPPARAPWGPRDHILSPSRPKRIVIGITGATGTVYAIRILQILHLLSIETHLIISKWALATMKYETSLSETEVRTMATRCYTAKDLSAPIASGSFQHDGMMIVPCSMKTLSAVRSGFCDDLISRAADVSLKEGRKLIMAVRETPLNDIHLENMLAVRRAGATIFPPVPSFYNRPDSLEDVVDQTAGRMLDQMGIFTDGFERWEGFRRQKEKPIPVADSG